MRHDRLTKEPGTSPFNLTDYPRARRELRWAAVRQELVGATHPVEDGGINIARAALDRHAASERRDACALRWLGRRGQTMSYSFAGLRDLSSRFANVLAGLTVLPGDVVATLLGRVPELYIAALGSWKYGAVFCPLYATLGPEPAVGRLVRAGARVLVTTETIYHETIEPIRSRLPDLEHVLLVSDPGDATSVANTDDFYSRMERASSSFRTVQTHSDDPALLHFTGGVAGPPKAALHVHDAVLVHYRTGRDVLDLHPGDVFWCTADPGWAAGLIYGLVAPLVCGATTVVDEAELDPPRWYRVLAEQSVTVWYTTPTAIRLLMKAGVAPMRGHRLTSLRHIASVGEPLNPEAVVWGQRVLGHAIHDTWWQTETGGIMIANLPAVDIKLGSMGLPVPGVEAAIVERTEDGLRVIDTPGQDGELALRQGWPSMFRAYLHDDALYEAAFVDGWYLTGDLARRDADGYFWFLGRQGDLIEAAGQVMGPFEIESTLMEHPAVAEAAVITKPGETDERVIQAFVVLKNTVEPDIGLRREILRFARRRLGSRVRLAPVELVPSLPRSRNGKLMRHLLRAHEENASAEELGLRETVRWH